MNFVAHITPNEMQERLAEVNAVRRQRRDDDRRAVELERQANATPETLRHKSACVADSLFARGKFTNEQRQAATEICDVVHAMTAMLGANVQSYAPRIPGAAKADWRPRMIRTYHERYIPWRAEAGVQTFKGKISVADVVFLVAVDNLGMQQAANRLHVHGHRVLYTVRESLYRYGELAGWYKEKFN